MQNVYKSYSIMKKLSNVHWFFILLLINLLIIVYNNFQFWHHLKTENFEVLTEFESDNIYGYKGNQILVNKLFVPHLERIEAHAKRNAVELIVNQSFRKEKGKVYGAVVAPVKNSNHLVGYAIDFNLKFEGKKYTAKDLRKANLKKLPTEVQSFIEFIRKDAVLRWGGDFSVEDPIHIDYPINLKNKGQFKIYKMLCNKDVNEGVPKWMFWH